MKKEGKLFVVIALVFMISLVLVSAGDVVKDTDSLLKDETSVASKNNPMSKSSVNLNVLSDNNNPQNGKWVKVKDLEKGMKVFDGEELIEIDSIEYVDESVDVYNMHVSGYENYFAEGVLVHNKAMKNGDPLGVRYEEGTVYVDGEFGEVYLSIQDGKLTVGNSIEESLRFDPTEDFVRFVDVEGNEMKIDHNAIRWGEDVRLVDLEGGRAILYNPDNLGLSLENRHPSGVLGEIVRDPSNPDILSFETVIPPDQGMVGIDFPQGSQVDLELTPEGYQAFSVYDPDELIVHPELINKKPDLVVFDPNVQTGELRVVVDDPLGETETGELKIFSEWLDPSEEIDAVQMAEAGYTFDPLKDRWVHESGVQLDPDTRKMTIDLPEGGKLGIYNPEEMTVRFRIEPKIGSEGYLRVWKPPQPVSSPEHLSVFRVAKDYNYATSSVTLKLKRLDSNTIIAAGPSDKVLQIYDPEHGLIFESPVITVKTEAGRVKSVHDAYSGRQIAFDSEDGLIKIGDELRVESLEVNYQGGRRGPIKIKPDSEITITDSAGDGYALLGSDLLETSHSAPSDRFIQSRMKNSIREAESIGLLIPIIDEMTPKNKVLFAKAWHELDEITVIDENPDYAIKFLRKLLGDLSDEPGDIGFWATKPGIGVVLEDYLVVDESALRHISQIENPLERVLSVDFGFNFVLGEPNSFRFLLQDEFGFPGEGTIHFPADIKMRIETTGQLVDLTGPHIPPEIAETALEFKRMYVLGCFEETIHALGTANQGGANYLVPWLVKDIIADDGTVLVPSFLRWVRNTYEGEELEAILASFHEVEPYAWPLFKKNYKAVSSPFFVQKEPSRIAYRTYHNTYFAGEGKLGLPKLDETIYDLLGI